MWWSRFSGRLTTKPQELPSAGWAGGGFPAVVAMLFALRSAFLRFSAGCFWPAFLLCGAAFAVYAPCLNGELIWDDHFLVGENPFFKSPIFIGEVFRRYLFLESFSVYYRPVQNLSYMVDYWLGGGDPLLYHLSNILYHGAAAVLLFLLLKRLVPSLSRARLDPAHLFTIAFGTALLWCVHPVHNAAVAYISGRADSLAMLLALGSWLLVLRGEENGRREMRWAFFTAAWLLALLALCAKEIALVWIGLFAIQKAFFDEGGKRRQITAIAVSLTVLSAYAAIRHGVPLSDARPALDSGPSQPFSARGILAFRALGDYARLLFFPGNLHMERTVFAAEACRDPASWVRGLPLEYLSILGLLTLGGGVLACAAKGAGRKLRVFGTAWFVIGFLPISNLFPLKAEVAEHWIYMPSIGFLLVIAGSVLALPAHWQRLATAALLFAAAPLGIRTAIRSADWTDAATFFKRTIADGGFTDRAVLSLANVYTQRGELPKAEAVLRDAARRFPDSTTARINLGANLVAQGRGAEAEALLRFNAADAAQIAPDTARTWRAALHLAHLLRTKKKTAAALETLDEAIARHPATGDLVRYKAELVRETGGPAAAVAVLEPFVATQWWNYQARLHLGQLRAQAGDLAGASTELMLAASLDIHRAEPFNALARAELAGGRLEQARAAQSRAVRRAPDQAGQLLLLAAILEELHRTDEARALVEKAESLRARSAGG
jgi:tetratricopeptide (TPR) repeat protein